METKTSSEYIRYKVSVIIPTYKRAKNIFNIVSNVLAQTYKNLEILIIDDNGSGTKEQKETYNALSDLLKVHTNIKYISLEKNSGACLARNEGIEKATGEFVAFLDDDDYWHPNFVSLMVRTLLESGCHVGYANFYRMDEKGLYYNKKESYFYGNIKKELLKGWCPATTSLFCIKRSLVLEFGGFNSGLKNLEEYDLWLRLSETNDFAFCDDRLVIKSETKHEQLTNNYNSRIEAWNQIKYLWNSRHMNEEEKKIFFNTIEKNILSDMYRKDLQSISLRNNQIKIIKEYGLKRSLILLFARVFGTSLTTKIKNYFTYSLGSIKYIDKSEQTTIEKDFRLLH